VKIYLAGNLPQQRRVDLEEAVMYRALERSDYNRLISYSYIDGWGENVLTVFRKHLQEEHK